MLPRPALRGEGWGEGPLAAAEVIQGARRSPSPGTRACAQVPTSPRTRGEVKGAVNPVCLTMQAAAVTYANFCNEVLEILAWPEGALHSSHIGPQQPLLNGDRAGMLRRMYRSAALTAASSDGHQQCSVRKQTHIPA